MHRIFKIDDFNILSKSIIILIFHHLLPDIFEDREIADPPDLIDIDPLDDIKSMELGALL